MKIVLETYVRETDKLVHLTINGEEIITTFDHPFYVNGKGFINASMLWIGAELINNNGDTLLVEKIYREFLDNETEKVYNFKVDEYHTYFVGNEFILVHNADYEIELSRSKYPESAKHIEDAIKNGQPEELTLDRTLAKSNRKASLKGVPTKSGFDRDEYPFAMTREGGKGADIQYIIPSDNRGSGSYLRWQLENIPDGKTFKIKIVK